MIRIIAIAVMAGLTTGCASIVSGQNQSVSVKTIKEGDDISGAKCELVNDKGTWFATTPASVTVRRSYNELAITCKLDGQDPGIASVKSATKGMAFGNILFGGFIGAGVDMSTGAAYDYPDLITVQMGKTIVVTPPAPASSAPSKVAATQDPFAASKK